MSAQDLFNQYFEQCYQYLFNIFNMHATKEYNQLKGQIIEAISVFSTSVSAELFRPHFTEYINLLISIQSKITDEHDPQKNFLLTSYERVCRNYPEDITPLLPNIVPSLFNLITQIIKTQ